MDEVLKISSDESCGDDKHLYRVIEPNNLEEFLALLADEYVNLRSECQADIPDEIDLGDLGIFSGSELQKFIASQTVPKDDSHRKHFSVRRADLSEVSAYIILEKMHNTSFAFKLIRDRELVNLPGRGIDAIGIENGAKLSLVLTEIKFSAESASPPQVVDKGGDSLRNQHLAHINERDHTTQKVVDCARRTSDKDLFQLLLVASLYLDTEDYKDKLDLVACSVLVRPEEMQSLDDFGTFKNAPADYDPANIRFLIVKLPGDMDKVMTAWSKAITERLEQ